MPLCCSTAPFLLQWAFFRWAWYHDPMSPRDVHILANILNHISQSEKIKPCEILKCVLNNGTHGMCFIGVFHLDVFHLDVFHQCVSSVCCICAFHLGISSVCFICVLHLCIPSMCFIRVFHHCVSSVCFICVFHPCSSSWGMVSNYYQSTHCPTEHTPWLASPGICNSSWLNPISYSDELLNGSILDCYVRVAHYLVTCCRLIGDLVIDWLPG